MPNPKGANFFSVTQVKTRFADAFYGIQVDFLLVLLWDIEGDEEKEAPTEKMRFRPHTRDRPHSKPDTSGIIPLMVQGNSINTPPAIITTMEIVSGIPPSPQRE